MTCTPVQLANGARAIVCTPTKRCRCGRRADLLCDWKVDGGTCDKPICTRCAVSPKPGKDLCPAHAKAFEEWRAGRDG